LSDVQKFDKHNLKEVGIYQLHVEIEGKVVFAKFSPMEDLMKTHFYHVVEYDGKLWQQHIFFRDYLNEHPEVAQQYEALKNDLVEKYSDDIDAYTIGKKKFVDEILSRKEGQLITENEKLRVRTLIEVDKFNLAKWLSDPEILQYYEGRDNPFDVEKVERTFFKKEEGVTPCIVEYDGTPIGYIQFYKVDKEYREKYGYTDDSGKLYGMDQFIGESAYWNKGVGTQLVRLMVSYLIEKKGADRIVMDPQSWNERAIRCYEKCGFKKVKLLPKHELHEGEYRDCWQIEYNSKMSDD
jgi:aminoglycoside 6'-N-acetyltransferase